MKQLFKKGELTTQQIVLLVILIASFAVILFFLFRLNLGEETQKQICHNSVIQKDRGLFAGNLDCKTNYLCVSSGEQCEDINPSQTVELDSVSKEEAFEAIAKEMADCWWQFGEGKADYVGFDIEGSTIGNVNCALCSIVSADENIQSLLENEDLGSLYDYLASAKKDEFQTYLQYLTGESTYDASNPRYAENLDFSEPYVIVTRMVEAGYLENLGDAVSSVFTQQPIVFREDYVFPPTIIAQSEISSLECTNFVTKA